VWEEIDSRKLSCLLIRFEENTLEGVLEPENKIFRCVRVVPVFSDGINTFFTSFGCISQSDAREKKKVLKRKIITFLPISSLAQPSAFKRHPLAEKAQRDESEREEKKSIEMSFIKANRKIPQEFHK
jgi:hypothetical protein